MTIKQLLILVLGGILLALGPACGNEVVGDDDTAGDDDTSDDDDSAAGDDDTADDDLDGDGFSPGSGDCNDIDPSVHAFADELCDDIDHNCDGDTAEGAIDAPTWYLDADGDGYGDAATGQASCSQPHGYTAFADDCNDSDPSYHPGAAETDCADPADYNCDGSVGYEDADGDDTAACEDCDDSNANLSTPSPESCDDIDNDCDGQVDEAGATGETPWYLDADGDGYGRLTTSASACAQPPGYVADSNDCDDLDAAAYPGAAEVCDEIDNDCNDQVDEGAAAPSTWYADFDGDGFGNPAVSAVACSAPLNYIVDSSDCNDLDASTHPNASEVCDGADNNCDTQVDEGAAAETTWYADLDGDSFGNSAMSAVACEPPPGYITDSTDCDDLDASSYPGGTEVCDGADNNCTGGIDEGVESTFYADSDGDGYGDPGTTLLACSPPAGASTNALDCDDGLAQVHPAAAETCDGLDNNCNTTVDEGVSSTFYSDSDVDGYGDSAAPLVACSLPTGASANSLDCNDALPLVHPATAELCDGIDNNCTGGIDEGFDGDGDGVSSCGPDGVPGNSDDDCDDGEAASYPGNTEVCDALDNNCVGGIDEDFDGDGDSFTTCGADGTTGNSDDDCDDSSSGALYYPGASEACGDPDYNCDGVTLPSCPYATVTFTDNQGVVLTDYAVRVDISAHSTALNSGFSVTQSNGGSVDYCFEVQSGDQEGECTSSYTDIIWVKVPSLPASGTSGLDIYPGTNAAGTGLDVFEVYEDFQDTNQAPGISGWSYNHLSAGYVGMAGSDTYYVGLNGTGLTSSVHKKIDYYQGTWQAESDLTLWLDGTDYGGDIDVNVCPGRPSGARSWTIIKTNQMSYSICGTSGGQPGPFSPSVGSSFEYRHRANDGDVAGMTLNWISMRPYVDNEPSAVVNPL